MMADGLGAGFGSERYPERPARERWQLTPDQADEVRAHLIQ